MGRSSNAYTRSTRPVHRRGVDVIDARSVGRSRNAVVWMIAVAGLLAVLAGCGSGKLSASSPKRAKDHPATSTAASASSSGPVEDGSATSTPAPASSSGPVEDDLVTSTASAVPSANDWGAQGARVARAPDGDLYTTYVKDGPDAEHFGWVLAERAAGQSEWRTVASGSTAHEPGNPPQVLVSPSGEVYVITISPWDSAARGAPEIWTSGSDTTSVIPGRWLTGVKMRQAGALYPSVGIDQQGDVYVWEDVPCPSFALPNGSAVRCASTNRPGTYYWAYRSSDGRWHSEDWQSNYRQTYNFLLATAGSDLSVVGTRDILQAPAEAPYRCPNGTGYCFDQTVLARWTNLQEPASSFIIARAAQDAPGYHGDLRSSAEDAYLDSEGRIHVIVSVVDATTGGAYDNHQLVISPGGAVKDVRYVGVPYPNLSRIVQDRSGRFWIYSVGPSFANGHQCYVFIAAGGPGDTDGTRLGPVSEFRLPGNYDCASEERNFVASPRTGTAAADYIDGVVGTNGGQDWVHYRISLGQLAR